MVSNKNNGLFDKIKKTIDQDSSSSAVSEIFNNPVSDDLGQASQELIDSVEQRLLKRFTKEKCQLAEEISAKYKQETIKHIKQQEQKFKLLLEEQLEEKQQKLKAQYEKAAKALLQKREKDLLNKFKVMQENCDSELSQKIEKLQRQLKKKQQELELKNQQMQNSIASAKIEARKEQEKASRALYEDLMQANHVEIIAKIEKKYQSQLASKEQEVVFEQAAKLRNALAEQKAELLANHQEELANEREIFKARINNEINNAVAIATTELQLGFEAERQALNATIAQIHPEIEANKQVLRLEIEAQLKAEFEAKFEDYKLVLDRSKQFDIESALATEKQKLAESIQEENVIILKYKEREIREACDQRAMQAQQTILKDALAQQEKTLLDAQQQQIDQLVQKMQTEFEEKIQFTVTQERLRVIEQTTHDNKILLQQQQQMLQSKFEQEKAALISQFESEKNLFLQQQQSIIRAQFENDKDGLLEQQKQTLEKQFAAEKKALLQQNVENQAAMAAEHSFKLAQQQQKLISEHQLEIRNLQTKLEQVESQSNNAAADALSIKHVEILQNHEQTLRAQFADELEQARNAWQLQRENLIAQHNTQLEQREAALREEFAATIQAQKQQQVQLNVDQDALREQFNDQLLQQKKEAALVLQRMQQQLKAEQQQLKAEQQQLMLEQQQQIGTAISKHTMQIRQQYEEELAIITEEQEEKHALLLEQERKKLNLQLAQDKSILIKDLTARFAREKQIAMEQYETELRDKLYKEMVKQKDYIQQKFSSTQEAALKEQKRRLDAEHRHEMERIKKGYFKPELSRTAHDKVIAERNVEQLANNILAKFKSQDK